MRQLIISVGVGLLATAPLLAAQAPFPMRDIGDLTPVGKPIEALRASPDGNRMAIQLQGGSDLWLFDRQTNSAQALGVPWAYSPAWSPRGTEIAFARDDDTGKQAIWTIALNGTNSPRRVSLSSANYATYSPGGDSLAFLRSNAECTRTPTYNCEALVVMPARGGPEREIARMQAPIAWSSDGRWLYAHWNSSEPGGFRFVRIPASGGAEQTLFTATTHADRREHHEIGLSADGRHLGVALGGRSGLDSTRIVVWSAETNRVLERTLPAGLIPHSWLPGNRIAAVRVEARREMRSMKVDGTSNRLLRVFETDRGQGRFSQAGLRISFPVERSDGLFTAGTINVDGTGLRVYEGIPSVMGFGVWSPDGQWLAYRSRGSDGLDMIAVNVATGAARRVGGGPGIFNFGWRPDGRTLVYPVNVGTPQAPSFELREARADAGPERVVTKLADALPGNFLADGRWWRVTPDSALTLYSDNGARREILATRVGGARGFSADGSRFAFGRLPQAPGDNRRMVVGVNGRTSEVTLPEGLRPMARVAWHPNGTHFFVQAHEAKTSRNVIVAVSITGAPARVIPIPAGQSVAAFDLSHDGAWIVYSADVTPRQTLVELDLSSWLK